MRVTNLTAQTTLNGDDVLLVDNSSSGTKKIEAKNLIANNAGAHNAIFRGKNLGSSVSAAHQAAIKAGTFEDLYIGDYWVINGVNWRIAHFDKFYNLGDAAFKKHHISIVPDSNLYNAMMNSTNITTGGYYNSEMKQTNLAQALTLAENAFGSANIASHRILLDNATSSSTVTGWAWYDSKIDLMTEEEVYGHTEWRTNSNGGYCGGINYGRLALFTLAPHLACNRSWYWLRTVQSASAFARVDGYGLANGTGASASEGVRPRFEVYYG